MLTYSVLENPNEGFRAQLEAALIRLDNTLAAQGSDADIVIVSPNYSGTVVPQAKTLLAPCGCAIDAGDVITYGMSPDATLTLSSIGKETAMLAIQREIVTPLGDTVEQQELRVPLLGVRDASAVGHYDLGVPSNAGIVEATLATASVAVMLGLNSAAGS